MNCRTERQRSKRRPALALGAWRQSAEGDPTGPHSSGNLRSDAGQEPAYMAAYMGFLVRWCSGQKSGFFPMEARGGVEPPWTDLQSAA